MQTMVGSIRNLDVVAGNVKRLAVRQLVTALIRQYGLDEVMRGVQYVYLTEVLAHSRTNEEVNRRAKLITEVVAKLSEVPE